MNEISKIVEQGYNKIANDYYNYRGCDINAYPFAQRLEEVGLSYIKNELGDKTSNEKCLSINDILKDININLEK